MDLVQKGAILRTRVALVNDLDVSDELCDALMSQDIFSPLMIEYIMVSFSDISAVDNEKQNDRTVHVFSLLNMRLLLINNI